MILKCITDYINPPFSKSSAFFLEVGKYYPVKREQFFNGIRCFILNNDPIGALYPSYFFDVLN